MAKNYSTKKNVITSIRPKKETISFILNYSKVLSFVKINEMNFEVVAN